MVDLKAKLQYTGKLSGFPLEYSIDKDITTIGRRDNSDIILYPQEGVWFPVDLGGSPNKLATSRKHAQIIRESNDFYIEDVGSLVGTSVNGKKLGECPLKEIYTKFYNNYQPDSSGKLIREKNRGKIKLKNGDKIVLGEQAFLKEYYSFIFKIV